MFRIILGYFVVFMLFSTQLFAQNDLIVYAYPDQDGPVINKNIYGHFSEHLGRCIYEGYWVGENSEIPNTNGIRNDVVAALKNIEAPVIRWPGGCFADEYHWMDGIGPKENRPTIVNVHWGGVTEDNSFGTHEFLELCRQVGCEPYICGNVGSGSVKEMRDWVEYITFDGTSPMANLRRQNGQDEPWKVKYWGVGNENWGCGGRMTAEYYTNLYKNFAAYLRNYSGNRLYKIAGGANRTDYEWTEVCMREIGNRMNGLSLHHYIHPLGVFSRREEGYSMSATEFGEKDWFQILGGALTLDEVIAKHCAIMDRYDPEKRIALIMDEWGTWYATEPGTNPRFLYMQDSLRDAVFAGLVLNNFNKRCERVQMTNIAQTVNVLQAMILTDGPDMLLTPTYHIYYMYKVHHDAERLPIKLKTVDYTFEGQSMEALNASASRDDQGIIHISVVNVDPHNSQKLTTEIRGTKPKQVSGLVLTASDMTAHNTFEKKEVVKPSKFDDVGISTNTVTATIPSKSVVVLEIR